MSLFYLTMYGVCNGTTKLCVLIVGYRVKPLLCSTLWRCDTLYRPQ